MPSSNYDVPKPVGSLPKPIDYSSSSGGRSSAAAVNDPMRLAQEMARNQRRAQAQANRKPTKKEQEEALKNAKEQLLTSAELEAQQLIDNDPTYRNGTYQRKNELLDHYEKNILPQILAANPLLRDDAVLRANVQSRIKYVFDNARKDNETASNFSMAQEAWALGQSLGRGGDIAYDSASTLAQALRNASRTAADDERARVIKQIEDNYNTQLDELNTRQQMFNGDPDTQNAIEQQKQQLIRNRNDSMRRLEENTARLRADDAKQIALETQELLKEYAKTAENEQARRASNEAYRETQLRQDEIQDKSWGLSRNNRKVATIASWLLEQVPQLAVTIGLTAAGSAVGGGAGAATMLGLTSAVQGMGDAGMQIFSDIINTPTEQLKNSEDYQEIYRNLEGKYKDPVEREQLAKAYLAYNAMSEALPTAGAVSGALSFLGPEALVTKTGVFNRLLDSKLLNATNYKGFNLPGIDRLVQVSPTAAVRTNAAANAIAQRAPRAGAMAILGGAGEVPEEVAQQVLGNVTYSDATGIQRDPFEGAGQAALQAFATGGLVGGIGGLLTSPSVAPETAGTTGAGQTGAQTQPALPQQAQADTTFTGEYQPGYRSTDLGTPPRQGQTINVPPDMQQPLLSDQPRLTAPQNTAVQNTNVQTGTNALTMQGRLPAPPQQLPNMPAPLNAAEQAQANQIQTMLTEPVITPPLTDAQSQAIQAVRNMLTESAPTSVEGSIANMMASGQLNPAAINTASGPTEQAVANMMARAPTPVEGSIVNMLASEQPNPAAVANTNNGLTEQDIANMMAPAPTVEGSIRNMMGTNQVNPAAAVLDPNSGLTAQDIANMMAPAQTSTVANTLQETPNANLRTNQGIDLTNSQATANRPGNSPAIGSENFTPAAGSSAAAQSAGTGRTSRQDARTPAVDVSSNQTETGGTGSRAGRRPDNPVADTTGTSADLGQRGGVSPSVQRTGDGERTEADGSTQPARSNVTSDRTDLGESVMDFSPVDTSEVDNLVAVADTLKLNAVNVVSPAYSQRLQDLQRNFTEQVNSVIKQSGQKLSPDDIAEAANAYAQLVIRLENTLAYVTQASIENGVLSDVQIQFSNDLVNRAYGRFNPVTKDLQVYFYEKDKRKLAEVISSTTFAHEYMHNTVDYVLTHVNSIRRLADSGNEAARQFLQDFSDFAHYCGIPENVDPFCEANWYKQDNDKFPHENAAMLFADYIVGNKPLPRDTGLNHLYRGATNFARRLRDGYRMVINYIKQVIDSLKAMFESGNDQFDSTHQSFVAKTKVDIAAHNFPNQDQVFNFFDKLLSDFYADLAHEPVGPAIEPDDNIATFVGAQIDSYNMAGQYASDGMDLPNSMRMADAYVAECVRVASLTDAEKTYEAVQRQQDLIASAIAEDPGLLVNSADGQTDLESVTVAMTSDTAPYDAVHGIVDPVIHGLSTVNDPSIDVMSLPDNSYEIEPIFSEEQEQQIKSELTVAINDELANGLTGDSTPVTEREWFSAFINNGGIVDENGYPQPLYRVNHQLSTTPSGKELETVTYGRMENPVRAGDKLENVAASERAAVRDLINRVQTAVKQNRLDTFEPTDKDLEALFNAQIDAIIARNAAGDEVYYIPSLLNAADYAEMDLYDFGPNVVRLSASRYNAILRSRPQANQAEPQTESELQEQLSQILHQFHLKQESQLKDGRYAQAVRVANGSKTLAQAEAYRTATVGPYRANGWMRGATRVRYEIVDENAYFRLWVIEYFATTEGALDSHPLYRTYVITPSQIRGAKQELYMRFQQPMNRWMRERAKEFGINADVFAHDIGQFYTDLHTIEANVQMEKELNEALAKAQLVEDQTERAQAVKNAQDTLNKFYERQKDNTKRFGIPGGKSVAQCRTEMQELAAKYGDEILQDGVAMFQKTIKDLVTLLIERGVLSEEYVASFGDWSFYCPLITKAGYNESAPNDAAVMFPSKLDYAREGSEHPAVDAYTALSFIIHKSGNALGSTALGREVVASYEILRNRYSQGAYNASNERQYNQTINGVTNRRERLGNLEINYYNGLAVVPTADLMQYYETAIKDPKARRREINRKRDLVVRVLRPEQKRIAPEAYVDEGQMNRSVSYSVIFDDSTPEMQRVKEAFRRPFFIDTDAKEKWGAEAIYAVRRVTSEYAQLNTTWKPLFPVFNSERDFIEKLNYVFTRNYRDDQGARVNGAVVAKRYAANLRYTPQIVQAAITNQPETIEGKVGEYLVEFQRQGIMQVSSLQTALEKSGRVTSAFVEGKLQKLVPDRTKREQIIRALRTGKYPFSKWAEILYSIPTFCVYKAFRDSGLNPNAAHFHTIELMNLEMKGHLTGKLMPLFPFIPSITQTATNLVSSYGFDVGSFGSVKEADKYSRTIRAWGMHFGITALASALIPIVAVMLGDGDQDKGYKIMDQWSIQSINFFPIPLGSQDYYKQQLGFGPAVFSNQAAFIVNRVLRGQMTLGEAASALIGSFIHNVSPVAGPQWDIDSWETFFQKVIATALPSVVAPVGYLFGFNKNYFGNTINHPEYMSYGQRKSDVDVLTTEQTFKDLAKSIYDATGGKFDLTPESIKEFMKSYATGVFAGIFNYVTEDPLAKDPAYKSTAEILGPMWTSFGLTMGYGTVGNVDRQLYYKYQEFYEEQIERAGLGDAIKVTKTGAANATESRRKVLTEAGFNQMFVDDVANLTDLKKELENVTKKAKKDLDNAWAKGEPEAEFARIMNVMRSTQNILISNKMKEINLYKGKITRVAMMESVDETIASGKPQLIRNEAGGR